MRPRLFPHDPLPMRLFFAHQSVGADLLQGLAESGRADLPAVIELQNPVAAAASPPRSLLHARLGRNHEPQSKLDAFAEWIDAGLGDQVEVAMLKFCYVDVAHDTAADALATTYEATIRRLREKHPRLRFAHCTLPLRTLPHGPYALLRRLLGHRHAEYARNGARERFNDRLRAFARGEPLFDLARAEATRAGRSPEPSRTGTVSGLRPEFSTDGGHLNSRGRKILGAAFLSFFEALDNPDGRTVPDSPAAGTRRR